MMGSLSKAITIVLMIAGSCFNAYSQKINLEIKNATVKEAMEQVKKATGYSFVFSSYDVNTDARVSVSANNSSIDDVIKQILMSQKELGYEIQGKKIIIMKDKKQASPKSAPRKVEGRVVDKKGEPIAGASIIDLKTSGGTISGSDGAFSLNILGEESLEVSCLGYVTKSARPNKSGILMVVLEEDSLALNELVVVGFGTQRKENLTGAVATISSKELDNRLVVSAANALQGLDPSVNLTMGTGSPESAYSVDIRGSVSINSSSPLILVDGIETDLRAVNAADIESISVLKDASASSVYGAKASAGVILVTTKSGGSEDGKKATINYSGRYGVAMNTTSTDFITCGYDYVTLTNTFYNAYQGYDFYQYPSANGELQKLLDRRNDKTENPARPWVEAGSDGNYYYYANFDWFGFLYNRTRSQQEHNISVNGGSDKFNYYISARYLDQEGIFKIYGDTYKDYSFRSKIGVRIMPKLKYSNNISFDRTEMKYPGTASYEKTIAYMQNHLSPSFLPYNPDGSIVSYTNQLYSSTTLGSGLLGSLSANKSWNSKTVRTITLSNKLDYEINDKLTLTASYGLKMRDPVNKYRNNNYTYSSALDQFETYTQGENVENSYTENHYTQRQSDIDAYATFSDTFGENHHFKVVAGMQYIDYRYSTLQVKQTDLSDEDLSTFAVANGVITLSQTINTLRTLGFFARANYDYKGKYLFEISGRADGSSRFSQKSRWGFFPSGSMGWRVSEEPFFDNLKSVWNNFKVRASVGSLGNQQVSGYYTYIDKVSSDNIMSYTFDDTSLAGYASVSAPIASDLTWETVTTSNLGFDMGFFKGKLSLNSDFYIRDTKNMLTSSMTLPSVYGASSPKTNDADLRTTGYEIYLRWNDSISLGGKPFDYGISATLGDYLTKITRFNNPDKALSDYYVGMTLGEIWGYKVDGLFATDEEAASYQNSIDWNSCDAVYNKIFAAKAPGMSKLLAGDMKFVDLNKDGVISKGSNTADNSGDRTVIGNSLPRCSYSFRFDFSWNNFDVSAFFQGVGKQDWYPAVSSSTGQQSLDFFGPYSYPMTSFISSSFARNCWTEENTDGYFPRMRGYSARADGPLGQVNDRYLQNVGYLRLKNLSLGYTIPFGPKARQTIRDMRVSLNGENLCYWSPLKKYCATVDPELTLSSSTNNSNTGVGYFYSKVFSVKVDLTF